ncbi:MAG: DNA polymerase Y family protein [Gammaproteobacteria bacterium]|nr:DNA polymerase Y family protein [Gammaproteobacteria bacterium]
MWLCVRFALLPLESFWITDNESQAIAICERNSVVCCNQQAYEFGVRAGQTVSTAYAITGDLKVIERRVEQEVEVLKTMALQVYPFSPVLSLWQPDKLLVEIGRSLNLFKGLDNLLMQIKSIMAQQSMTVSFALAPTPKAAEAFSFLPLEQSYSLWNKQQGQFEQHCFRKLLNELPVNILTLDDKTLSKINALGFTRLGDLLSLSESALAKRLGRSTVTYIQQLTGALPDVQTCFQPLVKFKRTLELADVIHHTEALLFPMKRLLQDLIYFLRLYQKTGQTLSWKLQDIYRNQLTFEVHLAESQVNYELYLELTRLKLESIKLTGPVESVELTMLKLIDVEQKTDSLFSATENFSDELNFASKIKARLGSKSCFWITQKNEVVPELASKSITDGHRQIFKNNTDINSEDQPNRPAWLFPVPQAIGQTKSALYWQGRLSIISQPERIVHYWWKKPVIRDYFIAQHESGNFYWVFFDANKKRWFVQGIFS